MRSERGERKGPGKVGGGMLTDWRKGEGREGRRVADNAVQGGMKGGRTGGRY